ncbi:MAG: CapA family protein [Chloroflexi bacterium]|nr:CapA family protein [Chloroflexota bacterium]
MLSTPNLYESESGDLLYAATGESLITRALKPYREPRYLQLRELLLSADLRTSHAEMLFHNYETPPTYRPGGTYMRCDPRYLEDVKWMGIQIMSTANNHVYDYGENGVLANLRHMDEFNMPHAGTGANMGEASRPTYLDTPKGRVAMVAATSSGPIAGRAGEARRDVMGRPGSNFIRWNLYWTVERQQFDALKDVAKKMGWEEQAAERQAIFGGPGPSDTEVLFLDHGQYEEDSFSRFVLGESFEKRSVINKNDLARNVRAVRDAARMADWVVFTVHNHEGGKTPNDPSDHIKELAHAVIDAGAHAFVGHGPHQDRGMEIYKGRPIFYALGDFLLENDTVELVPQDNYERQSLGWESTPADFYDLRAGYDANAKPTRGQSVQPIRWQSTLPMISFKGGQLAGIELHAVDLGFGKRRSMQGRPLLADGDVARQILERFQEFSRPFGTTINIHGSTATVVL